MKAAEKPRTVTKNSKTVSGRKRRYKDWREGGRTPAVILNNPKRGAPAFLLSCERGRESKCQREALEIIDHYYAKRHGVEARSASDGKDDATGADRALTLEEELKQLREEDPKTKSNFGVFQTGCSGIVFVLCTVPGSEMIPPVKPQKSKNPACSDVAEDKQTEIIPQSDTKRQKLGTEDDEKAALQSDKSTGGQDLSSSNADLISTKWDPVPLVRIILSDIENGAGKDAPSSRFVSRMIPLQVTCYASEEELEIASRSLIQNYFPPTTASFAISVKRRFCPAVLPKPLIIDLLAKAVIAKVPKCKVNLDDPECTVVVEICKTMCGLSVIPNCPRDFKNFNLAEAREKHAQQENAETS